MSDTAFLQGAVLSAEDLSPGDWLVPDAMPETADAPAQPATIGRPSAYNAELARQICDRLATGESTRKICRDPAMPARSTVNHWLAEHDEFRKEYIIARECLFDDVADEVLDIADDKSGDYTITTDDGVALLTLNKEAIARSKHRCDERWRYLAKLAPRKYGGELVSYEQSALPGQGNGNNARRLKDDEVEVIDLQPLSASLTAWKKEASGG